MQAPVDYSTALGQLVMFDFINGSDFSEPDWADSELVKLFFLISEPANRTN